jgi:hypothetical protein
MLPIVRAASVVSYCNYFYLAVFDSVNETERISWKYVSPSTPFELRPTVRRLKYSAEYKI